MSYWRLWLGSMPRQVAWKFLINYRIPSSWSITTHFNFLSFPEWRIKSRDLKIIEAGNSVCSDLWLFCQWSSKQRCKLPKCKGSFWDPFLLKLSKFTEKISSLSFLVLWLHFSLLFWLLCFSSPIPHAFSSFSALHFPSSGCPKAGKGLLKCVGMFFFKKSPMPQTSQVRKCSLLGKGADTIRKKKNKIKTSILSTQG